MGVKPESNSGFTLFEICSIDKVKAAKSVYSVREYLQSIVINT